MCIRDRYYVDYEEDGRGTRGIFEGLKNLRIELFWSVLVRRFIRGFFLLAAGSEKEFVLDST